MANIDATLLMKEISKNKYHDDIVVLCVNHDLSDDILLGYYLSYMFNDVTYIAVPYGDSEFTRDYRQLLKKCYTAKMEKGKYRFYFNEEPIDINTLDIPDCMDLLVTIAIAREVIPKIKQGKKLLVVEDGGHFSEIMENLISIFPILDGKIIGSVEQTTSGTKLIARKKINRYPQISVARSNVKMRVESIFIGQSIVAELNDFLRLMNVTINFRHIVLLGYGIIGYKVDSALAPYKCKIDVVDIDEKIRNVAISKGHGTYDCFNTKLFDIDTIVIGNCGNNSFDLDDLKNFMRAKGKRLYLCSGSSKDVEFRKFLDLSNGRVLDDELSIELVENINYHKKYSVSFKGIKKEVILISDGLPVNLVRASEFSVPDSVMDIVLSEIIECAEYLSMPHNLENRLYLVGNSDSPLTLSFENQLINKWAEVNNMELDMSKADEMFEPHPELEYLRTHIFSKNNL